MGTQGSLLRMGLADLVQFHRRTTQAQTAAIVNAGYHASMRHVNLYRMPTLAMDMWPLELDHRAVEERGNYLGKGRHQNTLWKKASCSRQCDALYSVLLGNWIMAFMAMYHLPKHCFRPSRLLNGNSVAKPCKTSCWVDRTKLFWQCIYSVAGILLVLSLWLICMFVYKVSSSIYIFLNSYVALIS